MSGTDLLHEHEFVTPDLLRGLGGGSSEAHRRPGRAPALRAGGRALRKARAAAPEPLAGIAASHWLVGPGVPGAAFIERTLAAGYAGKGCERRAEWESGPPD
jgi:hypothetical protein